MIESEVPWAIVFPEGGPNPRHPSQIYQSLAEGWLLLLTLFLLARSEVVEGSDVWRKRIDAFFERRRKIEGSEHAAPSTPG